MDDPIEAAYRSEHVRLWRALVGFCRDRELASEAEAEAWAQAVRGRSQILNPAAWVWTAAFRIATGLMAEANQPMPATAFKDSATEESPALIELLDLLGELSDQQRGCVILRYVGAMKPAEIAQVLGTTSASVRVQLHRAHRRLKPTIAAIREAR